MAGPGNVGYGVQQQVRLMPQLGTDMVTSVALSPDGRYALTGGLDCGKAD